MFETTFKKKPIHMIKTKPKHQLEKIEDVPIVYKKRPHRPLVPVFGPAPLYPSNECMCPGIFSSEFLSSPSHNLSSERSGEDLEITYGHIISLAMSILSNILSVEINDLLPVQYQHLHKYTELARLEILNNQGKMPISPVLYNRFQVAQQHFARAQVIATTASSPPLNSIENQSIQKAAKPTSTSFFSFRKSKSKAEKENNTGNNQLTDNRNKGKNIGNERSQSFEVPYPDFKTNDALLSTVDIVKTPDVAYFPQLNRGSTSSSLAVHHVAPQEWVCDPYPSTVPIFISLEDLKIQPEECSLAYAFEDHDNHSSANDTYSQHNTSTHGNRIHLSNNTAIQLPKKIEQIIGELVTTDVLQSDVEIIIDSIESTTDFLLAKRTTFITALLKNRDLQLQEVKPWVVACTNHSKKLIEIIQQRRNQELIFRQKLDQASRDVLQAKQGVETAIKLSLPTLKQRSLRHALEEARARRSSYLQTYERFRIDRQEAMNQLACVSDVLTELSADPERLSIAHLERTARSDLALNTFGQQNRNELLDKIIRLAKLRKEGQLTQAKIAAVGIAIRALKLRLAHIISAYWS